MKTVCRYYFKNFTQGVVYNVESVYIDFELTGYNINADKGLINFVSLKDFDNNFMLIKGQ